MLTAIWAFSAQLSYSQEPDSKNNDTLNVILLAGQSNMVGVGQSEALPDSLRLLPSNLRLYRNGFAKRLDERDRFGPEVMLSHLLAQFSPNEPFLLVKTATDGTSMYAWRPDWRKARADSTNDAWAGPMFSQLLDDIEQALPDTPYRIRALLWMQGENDAKYAFSGRKYARQFNLMHRALRDSLEMDTLPVLMGHINPPLKEHPARDTVRAQQELLAKALPGSRLIPTEDLSKRKDNLHYDTAGQLELGRRFFHALLPLLRDQDSAQGQASEDTQHWPEAVKEIRFVNPVDSTLQPAMFYAPSQTNGPTPLLVALHTWSGTYRQSWSAEYAEWCIDKGWAFVHPHFRGPNNRPEAAGSRLVVTDILEAVRYAKKHANIDTTRIYLVGNSGGGYTSLMMAGKAPHLWAGVSAWVPITDLRAWYHQSRRMGSRYADEIANACGGAPGASKLVNDQYRRRSPLTHLHRARKAGLRIDLNAGIHDGHTGAVPVSHTLNAFNELANPADRLDEDAIRHITQKESIPEQLKTPVGDPLYGEKEVLFRRTSDSVRVTIFEGGHEIIYEAALNWLSQQQITVISDQ